MATVPLYPTQQLMLRQQQATGGDPVTDSSSAEFFISSFFSLRQHPPAADHPSLLLDHQRLLQSGSDSRGRTVLTVLYLSVLGLCFVVPIFYYFRLHCEERHARRLREMEMIDFAALFATTTHNNNNNNNSNEEVIQSRAIRKKYREERRARILQLLQPVRVTLTKDHFPPQTSVTSAKSNTQHDDDEKNDDLEAPREESSPPPKPPPPLGEYPLADDDDEGTSFVELPPPGLPSNSASDGLTTITSASATIPTETRLVPSVCAICLSHYQLGEDVVWSSNPACEHAFHFTCVERWLSKQRDGPLCPCCRREFVIDPFDLQEDEDDDDDDTTTTVHRPSESAMAFSTTSSSHRTTTTTTTTPGQNTAILIERGLLRNPSYSYRRPDMEMPSSASVRIPLIPPMVLEEDAVIVNIDNPISDSDVPPNTSRTEPATPTTTVTTTSSPAATTNQASTAS